MTLAIKFAVAALGIIGMAGSAPAVAAPTRAEAAKSVHVAVEDGIQVAASTTAKKQAAPKKPGKSGKIMRR